MRVKYNTRSPHNPLFPPQTSQFATHPAAFSGSAAGFHDAGHCHLNSPAHLDLGRHLSAFCLACHLTPVKGYLSPKQIHRKLRYLRNPSTPGRATA